MFDVARSLFGKVGTFVKTQLTDQESEMFATLLAPWRVLGLRGGPATT